MIYFVIFAYLFVLGFLYDICGHERHRMFHSFFALALLVLVSGFRYRVGSDTVVYMDDYKYVHDLWHLDCSDFVNTIYDPAWILLTSIIRTVDGDFWVVQLIVSLFQIGVFAYFIQKVCPSIKFMMFVFYYLFQYTLQNMEVLRESMALSFFLFGVLALNENKLIKYSLFAIMAFMCHKFSFLIFCIYFLYYFLISRVPMLSLGLLVLFVLLAVGNKNWIYEFIGRFITIESEYSL